MTTNHHNQSNFIRNTQRRLANTIDTILNHSYLDALEKNEISKEKLEVYLSVNNTISFQMIKETLL